jgi:hypothetical protein
MLHDCKHPTFGCTENIYKKASFGKKIQEFLQYNYVHKFGIDSDVNIKLTVIHTLVL